jgi:OOP family OmpA-OmpF porin
MRRFTILVFLCCLIFHAYAQDENRQNLGANVNTEFEDIGPVITPDGKTLYYVSAGHPQNTKINTYSDAEDIWYSEISSNGIWSKAKRLSKPFNQRRYNSIESISPDGNIVYIRGAFEKGTYIGQGFSYVLKISTGWSTPQKMNILDYDKLCKGNNSALWVCPDGKTLILAFSNSSKDNNNDLYVCFKTGPNQWSKPKLIKPLNTKDFTETTPFVASDNTTIYFSSDRPGGIGDRDIWFAKRLDDTWENWSEPVNLGPSINSDGWDASYTVDAKGEYAYLVSDKNSFGKTDIIRIKLQEAIRPNPVVLLKGKIINSKNNQSVSATILYQSLSDTKERGEAISDTVTGEYTITLPYGASYSINANCPGYIPVSSNIDLSRTSEYKEISENLYLVPIEVGQTIRLNNIFFDSGKSDLRSESYPELDRLVTTLEKNPEMYIQISGHTDDVGADDVNLKLSSDRANAVKDYLIGKGIADSRVTAVGYGETKPLETNATEDGKQKNRRVEFTILKN